MVNDLEIYNNRQTKDTYLKRKTAGKQTQQLVRLISHCLDGGEILHVPKAPPSYPMWIDVHRHRDDLVSVCTPLAKDIAMKCVVIPGIRNKTGGAHISDTERSPAPAKKKRWFLTVRVLVKRRRRGRLGLWGRLSKI